MYFSMVRHYFAPSLIAVNPMCEISGTAPSPDVRGGLVMSFYCGAYLAGEEPYLRSYNAEDPFSLPPPVMRRGALT